MLFPDELLAAVECLLFVTSEPLSVERIAQIVEIAPADADELLGLLANRYTERGSGIELVRVAGGYQLATRPELSGYIERLYKPQVQNLSHAALEVLAIIAYKQPVTRGEIELIRGVQSDRAVATLVEKQLIKEVGRKDGPGRPVLFGTTEQFLRHFGLNSLAELPPAEEFIMGLGDKDAKPEHAVNNEEAVDDNVEESGSLDSKGSGSVDNKESADSGNENV
ncbi:MAG TPA: SMC-Scp complex subunit ScpB [Desulfobacteria bacterium]|nr:SMC-Scp complex subunit ScpB [Desulfobacteria bacterium]